MCDTMVAITDHGVIFAKNSDREPNEAQTLEWHRAAEHPDGARVRATWISIPQVRRTHAILISRPWWMWGAEMGTNEFGVTIGNEAVFTKEPMSRAPGLLGMDLLRLALERGATAEEAVEVIVSLLERYGQSGSCSYEQPSFTYHNSFLIADKTGAMVLETAGKRYAVEQVRERARSISNGLTIPGFRDRHADKLRGFIAQCSIRRRLTQGRAERARNVADMMAILRDTGSEEGPSWSKINGSMRGPNMHAGGYLAAGQTVGSWISDLSDSPLHYATMTADPALSVFKPVRVDMPCEHRVLPSGRFDPNTLFWRHQVFFRTALRDWSRAVRLVQSERDDLERAFIASPPSTEEALAEAERLEDHWLRRLCDLDILDTRPLWLRRRWAAYDRAAGLELEAAAADLVTERERCEAM